jgi:DNA mismatch repair protein MutS2
MQGVSTLTARLGEYARILDKVHGFTSNSTHSLILLDEFGSGTDQATGGALAQAILENLLENKGVKAVITTHSPRLKSLAVLDDRICVASVYRNDNIDDAVHAPRSFQLQYGGVGDSNGIRAAQRCTPRLPASILERAETILKEEINSDDQLEALKQCAIHDKDQASKQLREAHIYKERMLQSFNALEKVAKTYETKFNRMDLRLESLFQGIQDQSSDSLFEVLGEAMTDIRLMKKSTETLSKSLNGMSTLF